MNSRKTIFLWMLWIRKMNIFFNFPIFFSFEEKFEEHEESMNLRINFLLLIVLKQEKVIFSVKIKILKINEKRPLNRQNQFHSRLFKVLETETFLNLFFCWFFQLFPVSAKNSKTNEKKYISCCTANSEKLSNFWKFWNGEKIFFEKDWKKISGKKTEAWLEKSFFPISD